MGSLPPDQRVLYEELPLGEGRVYDGESLAKAGPLGGRPGVTGVLRVAALKAVGVREEDAPTGTRLRMVISMLLSLLVLLRCLASTACRQLHTIPPWQQPCRHSQNQQTDLELVLSPDGRAAAVVELRRQRVALLSADDRFARVAATFEPLAISLDGDSTETQDVILSCCWGPAAGGAASGGAAGTSAGVAAPAADRLLVACQSSCVYLLNR
jgi:hypothetical protein